jgi:hypothetical protein
MRKWTEIVKPYSELVKYKAYRTCIKNVARVDKTIEVQLEFLDQPQQFRRLTIHLPLPIRPEGLTADYFTACGLEVVPEARIAPHETIGSVIVVTFDKTSDSSSYQPVNFKPISRGESHESIQPESPVHSQGL